ncbi:class I SAM-dependent methyltransferase [Streptomyces varsoviensis]|uniref:Methyltransferase domain-containing protein n=1 Tax=Streptomyces varsoviensis TaxID=67373 RepID=A0ABR5JB99_9ACTN|nr:class I SAM-dependent methyltransferase [Streptomyces varsoviensis]KOG90607.1 hypothetical protein ADK38_07770 [Streptomyces varsoviensis]
MTMDREALWDTYWADLPEQSGEAFWDSDPAHNAVRHLPMLRPHFDPALPVMDLGCGNGTQSPVLAEHFERVIGVDIAQAAIDMACQSNARPNVEYFRFDVMETGEAHALHERIGDVNVYMRALFHQLPYDHRAPAVETLAALVGRRGRVFCQEPTKVTWSVVHRLLFESEESLPKLERLFNQFQFGLSPGQEVDTELEDLFEKTGFEIIEAGDIHMRTTETLADGTPLDLSTRYVIAHLA